MATGIDNVGGMSVARDYTLAEWAREATRRGCQPSDLLGFIGAAHVVEKVRFRGASVPIVDDGSHVHIEGH